MKMSLPTASLLPQLARRFVTWSFSLTFLFSFLDKAFYNACDTVPADGDDRHCRQELHLTAAICLSVPCNAGRTNFETDSSEVAKLSLRLRYQPVPSLSKCLVLYLTTTACATNSATNSRELHQA